MKEINEVFAFLDGRKFTHKGISGHLKHEISYGIFPYPHARERLLFYPDALGRQTPTYAETRKQLGDDWVTDFTDDIETYCSYAMELGFELQPIAKG